MRFTCIKPELRNALNDDGEIEILYGHEMDNYLDNSVAPRIKYLHERILEQTVLGVDTSPLITQLADVYKTIKHAWRIDIFQKSKKGIANTYCINYALDIRIRRKAKSAEELISKAWKNLHTISEKHIPQMIEALTK